MLASAIYGHLILSRFYGELDVMNFLILQIYRCSSWWVLAIFFFDFFSTTSLFATLIFVNDASCVAFNAADDVLWSLLCFPAYSIAINVSFHAVMKTPHYVGSFLQLVYFGNLLISLFYQHEFHIWNDEFEATQKCVWELRNNENTSRNTYVV